MLKMNIAEAKAKLSALVEAALGGEEVVLARGGTPVARIVPMQPVAERRVHLLALAGYPDVDDNAFAPEPEINATLSAPLDPGPHR